MDKFAKLVYNTEELLYKYKGEVSVPPMEMVDDILTIQKCGMASSAINAEVNAFIEHKKLTLSHTKCVQVHVGTQCDHCEELFVHNKTMNKASQVKYLGDVIHENGRPKSTISERVNRGYAIVGQILALLSDLPLGSLRLQLGLELRQAWLLNGILFNSEVWHSVDDKDIAQFVEIDKYLLRGLTEAHAKTPVEHLYLETAALPVPFIISARRMIYLQTILQRPDNEITKRVYTCQKKKPSPGDWCTLVKGDFESIGVDINDEQIASTSPTDFKSFIKKKIRNTAFQYLEKIKGEHSKVRENKYVNFDKPQQYLTSKLFSNKQCAILFALKSKTIRGIRDNFGNMYSDNDLCPVCERCTDTQNHLIQCKVLLDIIPPTN